MSSQACMAHVAHSASLSSIRHVCLKSRTRPVLTSMSLMQSSNPSRGRETAPGETTNHYRDCPAKRYQTSATRVPSRGQLRPHEAVFRCVSFTASESRHCDARHSSFAAQPTTESLPKPRQQRAGSSAKPKDAREGLPKLIHWRIGR